MAGDRGSGPSSGPSFLVLAGPAQGTVIPAPAGQYDFGREAPLPGDLGRDPRLFRHHGRITHEDGGRIFIHNLASAHGALQGGQRINERQPMRNGDVIHLGSSTLRLALTAVDTRGQPSASHQPRLSPL